MRRAVLLAVAAALVATVPARGASSVIPVAGGPVRAIAGGPFLAGDDAVFLGRRRDGVTVVRAGPAGRRAIATRDDAGLSPLITRFDADEGRVALATYRLACDPACGETGGRPADAELVAGPLDGPLEPVAGGCPMDSVDVAAAAIATGCLTTEWRVFEDGASRSYTSSFVVAPQVAGDFLAYVERHGDGSDGELRVLRRADMEEVLRVAVPIRVFDLAPDGSVAYALSRERAVGWSSIAEPEVHRIATPDDVYAVVRARDRVAVRAGGFPTARMIAFDRAGAVLGAVDEAAPAEPAGFDYDGTRLAWARQPCSRQSIVVWDLSGPPPRRPGRTCTPLRIGPRHPQLDGRGVVVTLMCPATARAGCAGIASADVLVRRRAGGRLRIAGAAKLDFDLLPGERAALRVPVGRKGLRRLRSAEVQVQTLPVRGDQTTVRRRLRLPRR